MRRIGTRLAVSDSARRTVARDFPGDYEVVPNGIDVERFRRPASRPPSMPDHLRFVLFVGRLEPRKGVDRLIRAMTIVQQHAPDARLAIVGDGPDRAVLEAMALASGVDVRFAGRVSDAALPAYYQAAELVCSPALGDESFGIVLLEAMAAGRPIVATRIAGYTDLVAEAGSARLVDVDDPAALANEITTLLDAPALRRTLGARGGTFVRDYDWSTIAGRLESVYLALAGRHQRRHGLRGTEQSATESRRHRD
jgi:phosphatidylinositol alpha-mannosyltransferase